MKLRIVPFAAMTLVTAAAGQTLAQPVAVPATTFPAGEGQSVVQASCAACHPPTVVGSKHYTADQWAEVVDQMIGKGAKVSDADYDVIVAYLARTYGPAK